jgi:carboxylesterase
MQAQPTFQPPALKEVIRANRKEFIEKAANLKLPSGVKVGALLIHGLTGMPNEMQPIARVLDALGCQVSVPMLAGHGASQKELLDTGWKDWLLSTRDALDELCKTCDTVIVGGLSMGGLLPVLLAAENPKVCGIVSLSPTIKYDSKNSSNPFQVLLPLIDILPILGKYFYWTEQPPFGLKDERLQRKIIKELEAVKAIHRQQAKNLGLGNADDKNYSSSHNFNPEQFRTYSLSLRQLQRLVGEIKKRAPHVKCPALIIQSVEDTLTTKWNAETLYSWLGSDDKSIIFLEGCDHVLTMDLKKEEVAYYYAEFVCKVAAAAAAKNS